MAKQQQRLRIEYEPLDKLVKWPRNPKKHAAAKIENAFGRFGFVNPPIVDETTGRIVAGHGRIDTAQRMKLLGLAPPDRVVVKGKDWLLPVVRGVGFKNEKEAEAYLIADNQLTLSEGFDEDVLSKMIHNMSDDLAKITGLDNDLLERFRLPINDLSGGNGASSEGEEPKEGEGKGERDLFTVFSHQRVLEQAFSWYRENGFPYPDMPIHEQMQDINRLAESSQETALNSIVANRVADCYQPERFSCRASGGKQPLIPAFNNDKILKKAIKLELDFGNYIRRDHPSLLNVTSNTQVPSNFRPGIAMHFYRRYAKPDGIVLDPCCGWGGRLVGWIASRLGGKYVGVDPNKTAVEGNRSLAKNLALDDSVQLIQQPFEDINIKTLGLVNRVNFVFTSPPYFNKELYSEDSGQSFKRYPKFKDWTEKFLKTLLERSFACLKKGSVCAVNIADIKEKNTVYPLEILVVQYAEAIGFKHADTVMLKISTNRFGKGLEIGSMVDDSPENDGRKQVEPVFIFEK